MHFMHEGKKPSVCSSAPNPLNTYLSLIAIQRCAREPRLSQVSASSSCGSVCEWTHGAAGAPIASCLLWGHQKGGRSQETLQGPEKRGI
ncbi:unnamed protein product [Staurois parvus]|uniref:Uncharacterized protein n=1 Tax=Staurois parvus TaxID=386267 RepID=A0ABN9HQZ8_9NEOB|nr:unnamed protein product [Staurois parvus]